MDLDELEAILTDRLASPPEGSYSITVLRDPVKASRKVMEEAFELTLELGRDPVDRERAAEEAADLLFHALAGLVAAGVSLESVFGVLEGRWR